MYGFYIVWYLILAIVALSLLANGFDAEVTAGDKAFTVAIMFGLFTAPVALHAVGTRRADEELLVLVDFVAQQAKANP
jgi:multisubunit Na+/H+ antiporter MnhG subunit